MIKVKLRETYKQKYWDSANGVTVVQGQIVHVNEDNPIVRHALNTGILEVVTDESDELKIISDVPLKETIKEIVTLNATEENRKVIKTLKERTDAAHKPATQDNRL